MKVKPSRRGSSLMLEVTTDAQAPFYLPVHDEVEVFRAAYQRRIPVLLKGPTGCGKTRFVEHMSWLLARDRGRDPAATSSRSAATTTSPQPTSSAATSCP